MIKAISNAMPGSSIEQQATVYNDSNATRVNSYGARVKAIYNEKPWKIVDKQELNWHISI